MGALQEFKRCDRCENVFQAAGIFPFHPNAPLFGFLHQRQSLGLVSDRHRTPPPSSALLPASEASSDPPRLETRKIAQEKTREHPRLAACSRQGGKTSRFGEGVPAFLAEAISVFRCTHAQRQRA